MNTISPARIYRKRSGISDNANFPLPYARGFGALGLGINKTQFLVGDAPTYVITGAAPNTPVLWSSTKNGIGTGETQSNYGQVTDANGNLTGSGGAWTSNDLGTWTKTATVGNENFTVTFSVVPLTATTAAAGNWYPYYSLPGSRAAAPAASASTINIAGYDIPSWVVYAGGLLLAWKFLGKK